MKRHLLLAAVMLFASIGSFAQSADTTVVIKNHEINIKDNDEGIKIKVYELKDGKRVTKEALYESNYKTKRDERSYAKKIIISTKKDEEYVTEVTNSTEVVTKSRWFNKELHQPLPNLYFSHLEMTKGAFGASSELMHQRPSSFEWGLYFPTTIYCTNNGVFGMATGLGISNSYNFFAHDWVLTMQDDNATFQKLIDYTTAEGHPVEFAHKSFLRYWSLRIPLTAQLQCKINYSYLTFSAGAELEWRFGMRSFAKYSGSKHTISSDLDYKAIGLNALFQVGYNGVIIFSRVGLTEFFDSPNLKDISQFAVGIGFNFD